MLSRRSLLIGTAGLLAIGVTQRTAFAFQRTIGAPYRPWVAPGALTDDPRVKALEWAVLVPNPHNRQPWLVDFVDDDEVVLSCNLDKRLPMTDPFDRQTVIGFGCFIEQFVLAAGANGYGVAVTPFPDGAPGESERLDDRPVAHLKLAEGKGRLDPLFAQAPFRRTNKEVYEDRGPEPHHLAAVLAAVTETNATATTDGEGVARLTDIATRAGLAEFTTERTRRESIELMRIGQKEVNANPDGIDVTGPMIEELHAQGLLTRETMMDETSPAFAQAGELYAAPLRNVGAWLQQVSATNSRADQIASGRDWLRLNLAATSVGLDVHPYSQALQEYEEVAPMAAELNEVLGIDAPARVQMLARLGYGPQVQPSPRWPARSFIL